MQKSLSIFKIILTLTGFILWSAGGGESSGSGFSKSLNILNPTPQGPAPGGKTPQNLPSPSRLKSTDIPSAPSLSVLAKAYEKTGDHDNHIRILKLNAQREPDNTDHLFQLVRALRRAYFKTFKTPYREEAVTTIENLLTKDPQHHEAAYLEMFKLLTHKTEMEKNKHDILELIRKLIRLFGEKKVYTKYLCKYLYLNEFYPQSLKVCRKAATSYPEAPWALVYQALSLPTPGEVEKSLKETAKKFPGSVLAQLQTGRFLLKQKDYGQALPYFQTTVRLRPRLVEAQVGVAQALFHTNKPKKAYPYFLRACLLDKTNMLTPFRQAKSILNQKDQVSLGEFFEKGINQCFHNTPSPRASSLR